VPALPFCLLACSLKQKPETAEEALAHGKALVGSMDYAQALKELNIATQSARTAREAHYLLGCALQQMGDSSRAQTELGVVANEDEHYKDARIRLAKIMVRSQSMQDAIWGGQWIEHEVAETKDNASADGYYVLGVREVRLGRIDEASKYLKRAVSSQPGHLEATKALAIVLLMLGEPKQAESTLLALPNSAANEETIGEFYRLTGDLTQAESWFRKVLEQDQNSVFATVNLADTLWLLGKRQEATRLLAKLYAARTSPFDHLHALAAFAGGQIDQGLSELAALSQDKDSGPDTRSRLVAALLAAQRLGAAQSATDTGIGLSYQDARAVLDRVALSLAVGKLSPAERDLKALETRGINSELFYYMSGALAFRQGDSALARYDLAVAVSRNPELLAARIAWVRLLINENKAYVARDVMDDTPVLQRRRPSVALQRAWVLMASGDEEEARRVLRALDPVIPAKTGKSGQLPPSPFQENLRFDLLEYPQGPVFHETDLELLSLCPNTKRSAQWLMF
jgi:tetratricopeptide (TPR) repeat protein